MVKKKEILLGAALFLITLLQAYSAFGSSLNLDFEIGNTSQWSTSYTSSFNKDYSSTITSQWSSEGNYSLFFAGANNGMVGFTRDRVSVAHDNLIVEQGDQVCVDFRKENTNNNGFVPSVNDQKFQNFLASGNTVDLCAFAASTKLLNITIKGNNQFGCTGGCFAKIFMDNVRVLTCRDGIMNQDESDIDCGGVCGPCSLGKKCVLNKDCGSFFCNENRTCAHPPSFSHRFNYNFEIGTADYWKFNFTSGGQDYTSTINENWKNEGNYSLHVAGASGIIGTLSSQSTTFFHNSTSLVKGDIVCMNLYKNESNRGTWSVDLVSGGNFIDFVPSGEYTNLCAQSLKNDTLGVTVKGTENFACTAGNQCFAKFFVDNLTINKVNCTDGDLDRFETDVDCGGFCSPCSPGKNCDYDFDCESKFCDDGICSGEENLLEKYAPVLYFHPDEQFFPTTIEAMLNESDLRINNMPFPYEDTIVDEIPVDIELLNTVNEDHYLDMRNTRGGLLPIVPNQAKFADYPSAIYGRLHTLQNNLKSIQYWFFYGYNDWSNNHEGDWEMIQIILNSSNKPQTVTFSFHHHAQTFNWDEIEKEGNHPLLFVAEGGHASYWRAESIRYNTILERLSRNSTFLTISNYSIVEIRNGTEWVHFRGLWGEKHVSIGSSGPDSPANLAYGSQPNRWSDPLAFVRDSRSNERTAISGSPVNLHAYDKNGKHVGLNESGEIEIEIPETYLYVPSEDGKEVLVILTDENIDFIVEATDNGAFNLSIISVNRENSTQNNITFKNVPLTNSTIANVSITSSNPSFIMLIDNEGDGIIDQTRQPDFIEGNQTTTETDSDNDGIADSIDNCPTLHNPNQITDFDRDGFDNILCGGLDCDDENKSINPHALELCDNLDNNCDSRIDENITRTFGINIGECEFGIETCINGEFVITRNSTDPLNETCNNLDDDCDNSTDENLMRLLGINTGECEFEEETCFFGFWNTTMEGVNPAAELCNGKDDDCDGRIDNKCPINTKEYSIELLQTINNSESRKVIKEIEKSLNSDFFIDEETLDSKKGRKVFDHERKAVVKCLYNWKLREFRSLCREVSQLLKNADQKFAEKTLQDAESVNATTKKQQRCLDKFIPKAEKSLLRGNSGIGNRFPALGITLYKISWQFSQKASKCIK